MGFLPIYIGPTLMCMLWWIVLRKMIRISKVHRITSLADFIASRYGKSALVAGLVTVIAVIGILPYISLQLKAISTAFEIVHSHDVVLRAARDGSFLADTAFYVALVLAAFTIIFGTRHLDASERHEGMVAAIAFESLVKLVAFLAVGAFVTWGMFDGFGDVFTRARALPRVQEMFVIGGTGDAHAGVLASLYSAAFFSMLAIMFLPRQFQVSVVENVDVNHVKTAMWLFPLYMLVINLFVLPIAFGGLLHFAGAPRRPGHLRAHPAARQRPERARAARLHRRPLRRDRHGDRRDDRAVDHDLQRPRDAAPAPLARAAPERAEAISPGSSSASAARRSS